MSWIARGDEAWARNGRPAKRTGRFLLPGINAWQENVRATVNSTY
jgi:hypothetical protein